MYVYAMVQTCVVLSCGNRWFKESRLSWHRFPSTKTGHRRKKWIDAINRKDWEPRAGDRVCGSHFVSGSPSSDHLNPDYVPTLNMGYVNVARVNPLLSKQRYDRAKYREATKNRIINEHRQMEDAALTLVHLSCSQSQTGYSADTENSPLRSERNFNVNLNEDEHTEMENLRTIKALLTSEVTELKKTVSHLEMKLRAASFSFFSLQQSDSNSSTTSYTGLPTFDSFLWLVNYVRDKLPNFNSITQEDAVLVVLMKLRMNLLNFDIARRFNVSETTVSEILNKCIPILADKLKFLIHWPEKDEVKRNLPSVFQKIYKDVRVIIDCTEIFVERPGNLTARAATWSNYKSHNTLKYLIAISPCGSVSFISRAFGGRTSDKVVTQRCGILDLLEYGDIILADRGFLIEEDIASRNCILVIPSFTKGHKQLSQRDVEVSRQISRVRIHVERAIGRLKHFKILSTSMRLVMVPHADSILTICSAISNLHPKLIK